MASITVRNIPGDVLEKIKTLSCIEKRSINSELLVVIERGTSLEVEERMKRKTPVSKATQVRLWKNLSGKWEDSRSTKDIVADIYQSRTAGREFPGDDPD
jgi:hypothetical protein